MKIACLTFHNSSNYGSILQSYALKYVLNNLGHDYYNIDYSNKEKLKFDSLLGRNNNCSNINYFIKICFLPYTYLKKKKFIQFSNNHLNLTSKILDKKQLKKLDKKFDAYFVGSDQVWNAEMVRFDNSYFLNFVSDVNKKISYAASFGSSLHNNEEIAFYRKNFQFFNKISVREKSAVEFVEKYGNKNAELVLDPTLLLTKFEWSKLFDVNKKRKQYILTYRLGNNIEMNKFVDKLSKQTGLKVLGISRNMIAMFREKSWLIPSPEDYIQLFANASYVVTNSFHGTAFSVNFNKTFFSFIKGNAKDSTNSRLADFINTVELKNRLYNKCPNDEIDLSCPDFQQANIIITKLRAKSLNFIKKSLENL